VPATVTVAGTVAVSGVAGTVLVDGSAHIQPVSGTVAVSAVAGTVDVSDRAGRLVGVVSGTVATGGLTNTELRASAVAVDGSAVTQPVSVASLPLPSGASTEATLAAVNGAVQDVALTAILERDAA
jgi:hypothetical protein